MSEVNSDELRQYYLPELLCQPLPVDLPQGNKNVLILVAAYYGNIERYIKLRRPRMIFRELGCLVRGVYHNSLSALWCATLIPDWPFSVQRAIHARMIMNDDLGRMNLQRLLSSTTSLISRKLHFRNGI